MIEEASGIVKLAAGVWLVAVLLFCAGIGAQREQQQHDGDLAAMVAPTTTAGQLFLGRAADPYCERNDSADSEALAHWLRRPDCAGWTRGAFWIADDGDVSICLTNGWLEIGNIGGAMADASVEGAT